DPGVELVAAAIDHDIQVDPIPGASAPLAALIGSGFPLSVFTVWGFAPNRSKARKRWLADASKTPHAFSFFEAPHRIRETLRDAADLFGKRPIILARELTKIHQEFIRGTAEELAERYFDARGEFTVVVGPSDNSIDDNSLQATDSD